MNRLMLIAAVALATAGIVPATMAAQSLDDLNIQIHGYATQGFLYSNNNNWNTTASTDGSAAWTEAVVNLSAQPESKLRIGIQARYSLLGNYGNAITLDWAQADYKFNEHLGIRAGKVKVPFGLFNETQDIDPAQVWVLLPQSVYPIASRDSILSEYGAAVYGALPLGESLGKLEYGAYAGEHVLASDDGYLQPFYDEGIALPQGLAGPTSGETVKWLTPLKGLTVGASQMAGTASATVAVGPYDGTFNVSAYRHTDYFAKYERGKLMLASEAGRTIADADFLFLGSPPTASNSDSRQWYVMATYKVVEKLSAGAYYSSASEHGVPVRSPSFYQKDWTAALRYDFSPFLYVKAEQHWMDGTLVGFSTTDNANLQPTTRMTMLKLGVTF